MKAISKINIPGTLRLMKVGALVVFDLAEVSATTVRVAASRQRSEGRKFTVAQSGATLRVTRIY